MVWVVFLTRDDGSTSALPVIQIGGTVAASQDDAGLLGTAGSSLATDPADTTDAFSTSTSGAHPGTTSEPNGNSASRPGQGSGTGQDGGDSSLTGETANTAPDNDPEPNHTTVVSLQVRVQTGHSSDIVPSTRGSAR